MKKLLMILPLSLILTGCYESGSSDKQVFDLFVKTMKPFSRGVTYKFVSNECIKHVQEKVGDFGQEFTYWNCKLIETHNTVYGDTKRENVRKLRKLTMNGHLYKESHTDMKSMKSCLEIVNYKEAEIV